MTEFFCFYYLVDPVNPVKGNLFSSQHPALEILLKKADDVLSSGVFVVERPDVIEAELTAKHLGQGFRV